MSVQGTCVDYILIQASHAVKLPSGLSYEAAAPLMCAGLTVYSALCPEISGLKAGDWVAIVGAAGGLGHLAVQYAKAMGFRVCALDTGTRKAELVISLGADIAFDSAVMSTFSHSSNGNEVSDDTDLSGKPVGGHVTPTGNAHVSESLAEFVNRYALPQPMDVTLRVISRTSYFCHRVFHAFCPYWWHGCDGCHSKG